MRYAALIVPLLALFAACNGGGEEAATTPRASPRAEGATPAAGFSPGDWVEVVTADDCLAVAIGPRGEYADIVQSCLPAGFVGLAIDGPKQAEGRAWWALAGQGWAPEGSLRFHHKGELPYPARPELAAAGRIVFTGSDGDVWIMNADGSDKHRLFELDAVYPDLVKLHWSPDGSKFAVENNNELHAIVSDKGDAILELGVGFSFQGWSPTGDAFTVARFPQEDKRLGPQLVVFDLNGDVVLELSNIDVNSQPSFSPDGRRIAFFQGVPGQEALYNPVRGIVADLQTGEIEPIDPQEDPALAYSQGPPLWSPSDPSLLAYGARLINLDSGQARPLPGLAVSWSSDGRFLFLAVCEPRLQGQVYDLETSSSVLEFDVFIDGTDAPCWSLVPGSWSPNGRFLLYFSPDDVEYPPRTYALHVWDAASGGNSTIFNFRNLGEFSPDGQHILFAGSPGFSSVFGWIWLMDADGSGYTLLAEGSAAAWQPQP